MAISSRNLFHFTHSAENLIGILTDEFQPRFCLEEFGLFEIDDGPPIFDMAVPMVCFCDLTLSSAADHLAFYGNYGLGLTKDWGIRNGVNPVLYLSPESDLNTHLLRVCRHALQTQADAAFRDYFDLLGFIKPIQGKMYRRGELIDKYFYDEREWRFVPQLWEDLDDGDVRGRDIRLYKEEYLDDVKRAHANRELRTITKLSFTPDDIKYIVVSTETEIVSMIRAIRNIKHRYDPETVDVLASRIISAEQIRQDF